MTRAFIRIILQGLDAFSGSKNYPTRTVEYAFSWLIIVWSYSVIVHTQMISSQIPGNVYEPMLNIMPAAMWGWLGFIIGLIRLSALIINGKWKPTPELRLLGAAWGMMFWIALTYCYYIAIDVNGGPDFPMRRAFLVLIFFEAYSCYRCGQDIGFREKKLLKIPSDLRGSVDAGYG